MNTAMDLQDILTTEADVLVVNLFQGMTKPDGATGALDKAMNGLITQRIANEKFVGKELESLVFYFPQGVKAKHIIVMGLGQQTNFSLVVARKVAAKSIQVAQGLKAKTFATIVHGAGIGGLSMESASQALMEGLLLGSYRFDKYKTLNREELDQHRITNMRVIEQDTSQTAELEKGFVLGRAHADAVIYTRELVNESPAKIKPSTLAEEAERLAEMSENISVTILDEKMLAKENYNVLLAVAAGSEEPPYMIHLHYKPATPKGTIAFVGKGVTFDSGGLGIKPWQGMLTMKTDMAGAANVFGIFRALANLEQADMPVDYEVHGVIATTENMISGKAMRPDDIITTKSGKTIEVIHTDAEGRLILSDALTYTSLLKPDAIIDYATLTGAAIRAVGRSYAAYMGNDQDLLQQVKEASEASGELAWELPLAKEYRKLIDSPVADLQNISQSSSAPDAIIGGLFLNEFVDDIPWVHIDIAGPSYQEDKDSNPVYPYGATGYGVLLGLQLLDLMKG